MATKQKGLPALLKGRGRSECVDCPHCGAVAVAWFGQIGGHDMSLLFCDACRAENERIEAAAVAELAEVRHGAQRRAMKKAANIPPKFQAVKLAGYEVRGNEDLEKARSTVEAIARGFPEKLPTGVIMTGPVGVGKTHLGVVLINAAIYNQMPACYTRASDLIREIKSYWRKDRISDPLEPWLGFDVLFIDEVETGVESQKESLLLDQLIDARWAAGLCCILATNLGLDELVGLIGAPSFDRLCETGYIIQWSDDCPSYRTGQKWSEHE